MGKQTNEAPVGPPYELDAGKLLAAETVIGEVNDEVERAMRLHAPLNSVHEAYAVILEEMDEFWFEVKLRRADRDPKKMRAELVQIAAMAIRTVVDLGLDLEA